MTVNDWKGLVLAGGTGSRLYPATLAVNKHLLPVYDKPMIFYPLTTLMFAGVRDIVLMSTPSAIPQFAALLGDGSKWGLKISYIAQERPGGIAEGLRLAVDHLEGHNVMLALGDNIFYGTGLGATLRAAAERTRGAMIFSYDVANPSAFGIVTVDSRGKPIAIEEKPISPTSRSAVTGLYCYTPDVIEIAARLIPSARGELEITDVNRVYLDAGRLDVQPLGRGIAWLDGGTTRDLFEAGEFVRVIEDRTGLKISCPEEVAFRLRYITSDKLREAITKMPASDYRRYLEQIA